MNAKHQIEAGCKLQQSMLNLLQLQWMYRQAQQNLLNLPGRLNYDTGAPILNSPQPNMNYFMTSPNGSTFQPLHPYMPIGFPDFAFKKLYNHAQSAKKNAAQLGANMQQGNTTGHQPVLTLMAQSKPIHYSPHEMYSCGPMQPPFYGYSPSDMSYMHQVGMQNPYYPEAPINVAPPNIDLKNNVYNNKHIYVNGTLYNTELFYSRMDDSKPFSQSLSSDEDFFEDEGYDPMDDDLPLIYGIRFYNPNYGPEGAIPPRSMKNRKPNRDNSNKELISYPQDICNWLRDKYTSQDAGTANRAQNEDLFAPDKIFNGLPEQKVNPKIVADGQNFSVAMSPNLKTKRRQGRGRSRGFTQSFGIVAPIKQSGHTEKKKNVLAAENILSLFDKKPACKKIESHDLNIGYVNWSMASSGKVLTEYNFM